MLFKHRTFLFNLFSQLILTLWTQNLLLLYSNVLKYTKIAIFFIAFLTIAREFKNKWN